jgi:tetratricopeptide (TPR) repeat protein
VADNNKDKTDKTDKPEDEAGEAGASAGEAGEAEAEAEAEASDADDADDADDDSAAAADADAESKPARPASKGKGKKKASSSIKAKVKEPKKKTSPAEEPDEFIAGVNRWASALRPHAIKIAIAVGLTAVLLIGWAVYNWLGQRKAATWTSAYSEVVATSNRPVVEPNLDDAGVPIADPDRPADSFSSAKERAKAVLDNAGNIGGSGGVAAATSLLRARQLMVLGNYDEAARAFAEVARSDLPMPAVLSAREGIGYAYEAKAETLEDAEQRKQALEQARQAFADMQPAEDGPRRDYALYHQARVLAILGKTEEARAMYQNILTTLPDSDLKPQVETRLIALGSTAQ